MPEFIRILRKESWLFVFSRCALALMFGLELAAYYLADRFV